MTLKTLDKNLVRPSKASDIVGIHGEPFTESFKGYTLECDGEVIAVTGVMFSSPMTAFLSIADNIDPANYRRGAVKLMNKLKLILSDMKCPVYTVRDHKYATADGLIRHAGFTQVNEKVYKWTATH